jgi:predicted DNA binding CopG/RHH family protein
MTTKSVQFFSKEYLAECAKMTLEERLQYLEDFRNLFFEVQEDQKPKQKSKLISIKMPQTLLGALKQKALMEGIPYQSLIKRILKQGLR